MASLLDLAQARLQGLLDIPTRAARAIVNPTAFSGLLGAPTLPQMQGTAEAAYGLPARQNMSVLDPNQAAYLQGYQQGEPLAYLGAATPFAAPAVAAGAKAVAPKAGMALENYMASQGLLQPLTAYHGTPHTIRGKFDISKVGTGEGAQVFGHGMYFAESPTVAEFYKNVLKTKDQDIINNAIERLVYVNNKDTSKIADALRMEGFNPERITPELENSIKKIVQATDPTTNTVSKAGINEYANLSKLVPEQGNLYKVDIPDEYIPNMLDWDKPLREQPEILKTLGFDVKKYDKLKAQRNAMPEKFDIDIPEELAQYNKAMAIEKEMREMPVDTLGKYFYEDLIKKYGTQKAISEALSEKGIKGIRYLDAGSRGKSAERSSNFVVFDPTDVKILEKNSQKVEGLLD